MTLAARLVPYGPGALAQLSVAVAEAKAGDPMALVTVVVPRGTVGLTARRQLAASPPGIVNVRFTTLGSLAADLALPRLAATGRHPATAAVVHEVARRALAGTTGCLLAPAGDQPATIRALARTYGDLRDATPAMLATLARQGARAAEVVGLIEAMRHRLAGCFDEADLVTGAVEEVRRAPGRTLAAVGPVVVHLPDLLNLAHRELVLALAGCVPITVLVGVTGDGEADGLAADLLRDLGVAGAADHLHRPSRPPVTGTRVLVAPSADTEVLLATRELMAANATGTPLERMAIAYPGADPYPRLVRDTLEGAGIPFNGVGVRSLASTVAGRTLLGLLEVMDGDWRRDEVAAWLTSTPLRHRGRAVPGTAWDALSREVGIVAGLADWQHRPLTRAAARRGRPAAELPPGGEAGEGVGVLAEGLASFMADLGRLAMDLPTTWARWAGWCRDRLRQLLGGPAQLGGWPAGEVAALDAVHDVLGDLAGLDDLDGRPGPTGARPGLSELRGALVAELDAPAPQTSRFGQGIMVGRIGDLVGLNFDVLCVIGMADGAFPERRSDDVLVPDREREACGGALPLRAGRAVEWRRDYLAALAGAPVRLLSFARGDQRRGRDLRPSRPLLDTLEVLAGTGRRLYAGDLSGLPPGPAFISVPSFAAAVAGRTGCGEPISEADRDLQSLLRWSQSGRRPSRHFLGRDDPVLAAGFELQQGRRGRAFTRFDGRLDGAVVPSPASTEGASATGLESFAACPRRYLFGNVLGLTARERPETVLRLSGSERGSLVHSILERYVGEQLALPPGDRIRPAEPWSPADHRRLEAIAEEELAAWEQKGLTGRPALWQMDRTLILADLRHFLREDDRYRRAVGAVPEAVEQSFGRDGAPPVAVVLDDGRSVRFRGTIDRIDRTPGGGLSVLDYKTGARRGVDGLDGDPVARGTKLQLALYGLAATRRYRATGPVQVGYWFIGDRGSTRNHFPREGFTLTPETEGRFLDVLQTLVEAIESGRFPGRPGNGHGDPEANCRACPFDRVCPADRSRSWDAKRSDPWAAEYVTLAEAG